MVEGTRIDLQESFRGGDSDLRGKPNAWLVGVFAPLRYAAKDEI